MRIPTRRSRTSRGSDRDREQSRAEAPGGVPERAAPMHDRADAQGPTAGHITGTEAEHAFGHLQPTVLLKRKDRRSIPPSTRPYQERTRPLPDADREDGSG